MRYCANVEEHNMPERIFPTQLKEKLGSKLEFNGIDIDTLVTKLAETQDDNKKDSLSPELREQIAQMKLNIVTSDDEDEEVLEREAKKAIPEAFKEHMFKAKGSEEKTDDNAEEDTEEKKDVVEGKKASARRRRIRFTNASQLSPEAVIAAKEQGDEELYQAILAARSDVRVREAQRLIDLSEEALKREASAVSKRNAFRMTVVSNDEKIRKTVASAKNASTPSSDSVFKTVKSMTNDERNYFRRVALDRGLPEEYVASMFAEETPSNDSSVELNIRDIMASALNVETKKAAIGGLVKTAVLDNENISRLKKYWKDELGYGDEAWIDDLFTTKYDK